MDGPESERTLDWLTLSLVATGATGPWLRAAAAAGSAAALLRAERGRLRALGLGGAEIAALAARPPRHVVAGLAAACAARGVEVAVVDGPTYPALLRAIDDPPLVLYYRGVAPSQVAPAVAVVGSRRASRYGLRVADSLARALARAGFWVVSGLALGIDGAAHAAALRDGRSAAVLAGGVERSTPRTHARLYAALVERGCVLSEHRPRTPTLPHHFPIRNRIITGLCTATVVVEAGERSGSLISARLAAEQGRDVLAVPGNIDSATSAGTNRLLRDGCVPALDCAETVAELARAAARFGPRPQPREPGGTAPCAARNQDPRYVVDADAGRLLALLDGEPKHVDCLAEESRLAGSRVLELLTTLELDGRVRRVGAGAFVRTFDLTPRQG